MPPIKGVEQIDSSYRDQFEKLGEAHVRMDVMTGKYVFRDLKEAAIKWLSIKDQESRLLNNASQAEQIEIARSAKDAAWAAARAAQAANKRATIALVIAAMSIIIAGLAWRYPHGP